jgi:Trm5-related predicted tRNA methylase
MAKQLKYKQILVSKRKEEREARKKFKKEMRENGVIVPKPKKDIVLMKDSDNTVSIVIDMNFTELMSESDFRKLRKQILRCYSMNRSSKSPVQFHLTSCSDQTRRLLEGSNSGFSHWDIHTTDQNYLQLFAAEDQRKSLVYLTRDSDNVLPDAAVIKKDAKIYVIGGLVDHNSHKGLTLTRSQSEGISHARLPIDEHMRMLRTQVLTVNQVFELMLLVSQGTEWPDALRKVIPQRKLHPDSKIQQSESTGTAVSDTEQSIQTCDTSSQSHEAET